MSGSLQHQWIHVRPLRKKTMKLHSERSLVAGDEVGGVGPGVVVDRVGEVVGEVLERALSGDDGLDEESEHGEHGEAAVLELLDLELGQGLGVVGQAEGVEAAAGVERVDDLAERAAGNAVALDGAHEHDLAGPDGEDALGVDQAGVAEVVEPALAEDLGAGLEPDGLAELDAVAGEQLGEDAAERAEHGPAGVDDLQLAVLGEGLGVSGQPRGVPAVVAGELAGQVARGLAGEGAEVLDAVGAVPRAAGRRHLGLGRGLAHGDAALAEGPHLDGGAGHRRR
ncbi:hypothetical protein C2845_PM03G05550 [Panicum miliaceum]|uniref:Uncharacterized protein n=1 Tax=Panicum miliaceum TaxID=4540 RepID=A0A3L6T734_PANMI|nr:hypothetical protein C2845_PM03G05550 [Panicum miliaceum]